MSETTATPLGLIDLFDFDPFRLFVPGYYHLANTFAILDDKIVVRQIDEYDSNFRPNLAFVMN